MSIFTLWMYIWKQFSNLYPWNENDKKKITSSLINVIFAQMRKVFWGTRVIRLPHPSGVCVFLSQKIVAHLKISLSIIQVLCLRATFNISLALPGTANKKTLAHKTIKLIHGHISCSPCYDYESFTYKFSTFSSVILNLLRPYSLYIHNSVSCGICTYLKLFSKISWISLLTSFSDSSRNPWKVSSSTFCRCVCEIWMWRTLLCRKTAKKLNNIYNFESPTLKSTQKWRSGKCVKKNSTISGMSRNFQTMWENALANFKLFFHLIFVGKIEGTIIIVQVNGFQSFYWRNYRLSLY